MLHSSPWNVTLMLDVRALYSLLSLFSSCISGTSSGVMLFTESSAFFMSISPYFFSKLALNGDASNAALILTPSSIRSGLVSSQNSCSAL